MVHLPMLHPFSHVHTSINDYNNSRDDVVQCAQLLCCPLHVQVAVSYTDSRAALASKPAPSKLTGGQLLAATTASFTASGAMRCTSTRTECQEQKVLMCCAVPPVRKGEFLWIAPYKASCQRRVDGCLTGAKGSSSSSTVKPVCIGKVGMRMLYSTGASATSSPEDDFVLIETAESIASQASRAAALLCSPACASTAAVLLPVNQQQRHSNGASGSTFASAALPVGDVLPITLQALRGTSGELPASATVPGPDNSRDSSKPLTEAKKAAGGSKDDKSAGSGAVRSTTAVNTGTAIMVEASDIEVIMRQNEDVFKQMSGAAQRLVSGMNALTKRAAIRSETGEALSVRRDQLPSMSVALCGTCMLQQSQHRSLHCTLSGSNLCVRQTY